jgi:DNA-binding IclR family transcriptional regulator
MSEMPEEKRTRVEAVERSLSLLQCFERPGEQLSLAALAQRSHLYKSTILRLTASLVYMGFLQRDAAGLFTLGPELRRLGALSASAASLEALVRPVLRELTAATQETASFYVRDGVERVCLYRLNSPLSARHHLDEGGRHPLGSGAAGKILRAYGLDAEGGAARQVRQRGWATSDGERDPDLAAVAVPLLDRHGALLGALTVSGVRSRFTTEKLDLASSLLIDAAQSLLPRLPFLASTDLQRER